MRRQKLFLNVFFSFKCKRIPKKYVDFNFKNNYSSILMHIFKMKPSDLQDNGNKNLGPWAFVTLQRVSRKMKSKVTPLADLIFNPGGLRFFYLIVIH